MPVTETKIRRGTNAECLAMTPASSEVIHDTTNKRIHIGDGVVAGGLMIPNRLDIVNNTVTYKAAGGTANALTVTLDFAPLAYTAGMIVLFKATATNTTAATVNVNGLGVKNIYKNFNGAIGALTGSEILTDGIYQLMYDGTQFQLMNAPSASTSQAGWELLSIATASASSTLDFTGIDGTYKDYVFILNALVCSSACDLYIRTDENNGASFDSGATDYAFAHTKVAGTTQTLVENTGATHIMIGSPSNSAVGWQGIVWMLNRGSARWQDFMFDGAIASATGTTWVRMNGHGHRKSSSGNPQNAVRFLPSAGNFTSGNIMMFGLRSSL
jgi:hypothetical protein